MTPEGELLDFAPKGGETFYNGLKYGSDGSLYGVRSVRAVFQITEGNAPATYAVFANGTQMLDLDFDQNLNLWTGGSGGRLYSVTPEKEITEFEFEPRILSIRVYNGYLYVAGATETEEAVWRFEILGADNLGEVEKRNDEMGGLARVFSSMAAQVYERERNLKEEVTDLREKVQLFIEIDEVKKARDIHEITESDYFNELRKRVDELRKLKYED